MSARTILCVGAHPDDNEFSVSGTAALLRKQGHTVYFLSVTDGARGHFTQEYRDDPELLIARRRQESLAAASVIGAIYITLGIRDGDVYVDLASTEAMVRAIRGCGPEGEGPDLVLLNRPSDYHRDHRNTAQLVLDATYMLTVPLYCPNLRHLNRMPVFAYWYDDFTEVAPFRADIVVPIDTVIEQKIDMLCCHASQLFEWLPYNAGRLDSVPPAGDAAGRREFVAQTIRQRGAHRMEKTKAVLERTLPGVKAQYVEAFAISEYGRRPSAEELGDLFGLPQPAGKANAL